MFEILDAYERGRVNALKWIPVSERLPADEKWVLCLTNTGMYWIALWNYCNDGLWTDHETWSSKTYITHWMPLPEPPKEE